MKADNSTSGHPRLAAKQDLIVASLREDITSGRLEPGARLPSQLELVQRFGVSGVTVRFAISRLQRDGFLETRPRSGTYVVENPPHLDQYALIFWNDPAAPLAALTWSRYYQALTHEAVRLQQGGQRILLFHGINEHADSEDRWRLESYIRSHRLAGLIFANHPYPVSDSLILQQSGLPRVSLASDNPYPTVKALAFDRDMWLDKALAFMVARNRKRIALITTGPMPDFVDEGLTEHCAAHGLTLPDYWRQSVNWSDARAVRNCTQLLVRGAGGECPDGLLISDDNLVEPVMAGLVATGVRVPDDLDVVAHTNFPYPPACPLSARKLGFNIRDTLLMAMDLIHRQRRGEEVPQVSKVPAVFEQEANDGGLALPAMTPAEPGVDRREILKPKETYAIP